MNPPASARPFVYSAYGLVVHSAFELPFRAVEPHDPGFARTPDVRIVIAPTPPTLDAPAVRYGLWQAAPGEFLLVDEHLCRILVRRGDEITVQPAPGADPREISVWLNGSAFAALLHQRGDMPLHASAVATPSGAILFAGPSGVGKSTLMAAMQKRGYKVISDDVSAIRLEDGGAFVAPAFSHMRLWPDSIDKLDFNDRTMRPLAGGLRKFVLPVDGFSETPQRVRAVYALGTTNRAAIALRRVRSAEAFSLVSNLIYRRKFAHGLGAPPKHFRTTAQIVKQARAVEIQRPGGAFLLKELADRIEADLSKIL